VRVVLDTVHLSSKAPDERPAPAENTADQGRNVLDNSVGRKLADNTNTAATLADGSRGLKPGYRAIRAFSGSRKLGWLISPLVILSERVVGAFAKLPEGVKGLASLSAGFAKASPLVTVVAGLAKAAPVLGMGIALLDIGKAVLEKNPEKKVEAKGTAVLSLISGVAGLVTIGGALGYTSLGIALAPLAVPAMIIGSVATVLALADQFWLGGKVAKVIGSGLDAIGKVAS
jgi:hypothetical protein